MNGTVSTHSRLKAAGTVNDKSVVAGKVSTHSRLKAAGLFGMYAPDPMLVSTHSRLKAAGLKLLQYLEHKSFQHTAA